MLTRRLGMVLALVGVLLGAAGLQAHGDEPCDRDGSYYVECGVSGDIPGPGGGDGSGSGSGDDGSGKGNSGGSSGTAERICRIEASGDVVPCVSEEGYVWYDHVQSYCTPVSPQPDYSDPIWGGRTEGAIYECHFPFTVRRWFSTADTVPTPPPNPEALAQQLIARIDFQAIDLGIAPEPLEHNPDSLGAVGLPVWLWADTTGPNVTGPVSDSISERGYTVTLTATMNNIVWDLGDGGDPITCGIGQRFDPATMGVTTPVVCGRQAGYSQQGEYTISATSHWEVRWQGIGRSGTIPMEVTSSGTVRIGEIQVVVTDN